MSDKKQESMRSVAVTMYSDEVSNQSEGVFYVARGFQPNREDDTSCDLLVLKERLPYSTLRVCYRLG